MKLKKNSNYVIKFIVGSIMLLSFAVFNEKIIPVLMLIVGFGTFVFSFFKYKKAKKVLHDEEIAASYMKEALSSVLMCVAGIIVLL